MLPAACAAAACDISGRWIFQMDSIVNAAEAIQLFPRHALKFSPPRSRAHSDTVPSVRNQPL